MQSRTCMRDRYQADRPGRKVRPRIDCTQEAAGLAEDRVTVQVGLNNLNFLHKKCELLEKYSKYRTDTSNSCELSSVT